MLLKLERDLTPLKQVACRKVDEEAEASRLRFLTPGAGQGRTYDRKLAEALAILRGEEMKLYFLPPGDVRAAQEIVDAADHAYRGLKAVDDMRLAAKTAIRAARNAAEIEVAATVDWSAI